MSQNLNPPPTVPPPADDVAELRALVWRQLQEINRLTAERDAADNMCLRIANEAADASKVRQDTLKKILAEVQECGRLTLVTAHQRDCCERALRSLVEVLNSISYDTEYSEFQARFATAKREAVELLALIDVAKNK